MATTSTSSKVQALTDLPLMLTVEEAASILRIGRNGAYAAVADGSLPSIRIGRRIRVPKAGLAALLNGEAESEAADPATPAASEER